MDNDVEIRLNKEISKLNEAVRSCKLIEETIGTKGWQEIVEPLLDKMINDILGAKVKGRWDGGIINNVTQEKSPEFYIGYKQALIDFHNRVYAYNDNVELYEKRKEDLVNGTKARFKTPMIDDKRY